MTRASLHGSAISAVKGSIVIATGLENARMYDLVRVGNAELAGEIVRVTSNDATIQVYENTTMLTPGEPVQQIGAPLEAWLGPGLIGNIYDGIQRPLPAIYAHSGPWIGRGEKTAALDQKKRWSFQPLVRSGAQIRGGQSLGLVQETALITHQILVPPDVAGIVVSIAEPGDYTIEQPVAAIETTAGVREIQLAQRWPIRVPRPVSSRERVSEPLVTGQRVIDIFFPIAKGGAAAIPGGFGTGKTVTQHQLAKWSDAQVIIFVGCGERGNEMTQVLTEFPQLTDPRTGRSLMERTILIANTSNMPVAAREVSIYTGMTLAEYYRDMGLHVAVFADSTSRWAEALRELAARLEEMPAEEGFPASLPARLAQFYERGGAVTTLGGQSGSVTVVGAVSPPGGDFSEPVTQHTRRFIRCFWALDTELANARHYPSIHWLRSYSDYVPDVSGWWEKQSREWTTLRTQALTLLQREERLQQISRLIGSDALPENERLILYISDILKNGFLAQNSFDHNDAFCTPSRQIALLRLILGLYLRIQKLLAGGVPLERVQQLPSMTEVIRAKSDFDKQELAGLADLERRVLNDLDHLDAQPR